MPLISQKLRTSVPTAVPIAIGIVFDKGYTGCQGSEKDISESVYSTYFRILDTRIGRWFSRNPEFQPWQSPYCSIDNNPIIYNDIFGDKIIVGEGKQGRQEMRQLRKRDDWKQLKKDYGKGSDKDLHVQRTHNSNVTATIMTALPQGELLNGQDLNKKEFHLFYVEYEEKEFLFNNKQHGGYLHQSNETFTRNYDNINIIDDFYNGGESLNKYLKENQLKNAIPSINLIYIHVKTDDLNKKKPAVYSFKLNGNPWNLGLGGPDKNTVAANFGNKYRPVLGTNLKTGDNITATGIWTNQKGYVDECNGFVLIITVTIRKNDKK